MKGRIDWEFVIMAAMLLGTPLLFLIVCFVGVRFTLGC
jgi:hypothetical protein